MRSKSDIRSFERTRAANIVASYENELHNKLSANPNAGNAQQVETIIARLRALRKEIMGSIPIYRAPIKRDPGGDFSQAEVEAAMDFLNEDKEDEENQFL